LPDEQKVVLAPSKSDKARVHVGRRAGLQSYASGFAEFSPRAANRMTPWHRGIYVFAQCNTITRPLVEKRPPAHYDDIRIEVIKLLRSGLRTAPDLQHKLRFIVREVLFRRQMDKANRAPVGHYVFRVGAYCSRGIRPWRQTPSISRPDRSTISRSI